MWYSSALCLFFCISVGFGTSSIINKSTETKNANQHPRLISVDEFHRPVTLLQSSSVINEIPNDVLLEQFKALSSYIYSHQNIVKREVDKQSKSNPGDSLQFVDETIGGPRHRRSMNMDAPRAPSGSGTTRPASR
ncbi:hypothetical protein C0J52_03281 [Blattella germanica]|nr:hypothetical protein C0J52_03281 [Blattella germanica]